ncbi:MAG: hypothetical protein HOG49_24850 [Candidatus Scalindua sp.]|jgi:hypothetical protein|nr:hypothetical protein [Candidatus Scalindua sp.]
MSVKQLIRTRSGEKMTSLTPLKAIRAQCLECVGWVANDVRKCSSPKCSLYGFRMGNLK